MLLIFYRQFPACLLLLGFFRKFAQNRGKSKQFTKYETINIIHRSGSSIIRLHRNGKGFI